jgi:hypothetical protein
MEIIGNMSIIEHELACFLDDSYGWGDYFFLNERHGTFSTLLAQSRLPNGHAQDGTSHGSILTCSNTVLSSSQSNEI